MDVKRKHIFSKHFEKYVKSDKDKQLFMEAIQILLAGKRLPTKFDDHQLKHQQKGVRDFHLENDLVTVYYYVIDEQLVLIDVVPHNVVFKRRKQFK